MSDRAKNKSKAYYVDWLVFASVAFGIKFIFGVEAMVSLHDTGCIYFPAFDTAPQNVERRELISWEVSKVSSLMSAGIK